MTPTGLGLLTLRFLGKVFQRGNTPSGCLDPASELQAVIEDFPAKQEMRKIRSGWSGDLDYDGAGNGGVTGQNSLPTWFAYLGLRQN
jgi:hypothetical protein